MFFTDQLIAARQVSFQALTLDSAVKKKVLQDLQNLLHQEQSAILAANEKDIAEATKQRQTTAFLDRLLLTEQRVQAMCEGIESIMNLPDPIGEQFDKKKLTNGMTLYKVRVPIGVILVVYEARPNVTTDVFSLCFKSSNVCLLKGGSLSQHTNQALIALIHQALLKNFLSEDFCQYIHLEKKQDLSLLLQQDHSIDLVIPRGGESLIRTVVEHSTIPVLKHDKGICHIYIDKDADVKKALKVSLNAKINRPATCNAVDVLLVHQDIARNFIPSIVTEYQKHGVEIRGCEKTRQIFPAALVAKNSDWDTEFLDLIIGIKVVTNSEEAIDFINTHSSKHTETIMTENHAQAEEFIKKVDAGVIFVNASTRLNDGGIFGLGAEMGISTQKIHARGPVGLVELTSYKWVGEGTGQIRE